MIAVALFVGLVLGGISIGFLATAAAPVGFEDGTGFHFGSESEAALPNQELAHGLAQARFA